MATRMKKDEMLRLSDKVCRLLNDGFSFNSVLEVLGIRMDTLSKSFMLGIEKGKIDLANLKEKIYANSMRICDLPIKDTGSKFYSFEVDEMGRIILTPYSIDNE